MNRLNVNRLAEVLSEILTEKHGAKVTITFTPKESEARNEQKTA